MILITGGTGLVGSYVTAMLLRKKQPVRLLLRSTSHTGYLEEVLDFHKIPEDDRNSLIERVTGDIMDIPSLEKAFAGVEKLYHSAAMISFLKRDREKMMRINSEGTANVVNMALASGVRKVCHVSSIAALGRPDDHQAVIDETIKWVPSKLNTGYAISKNRAEWEVKRGWAEGLETVIVNPSIILGQARPEKGSARIFETAWNGLRFYPPGVNGFVDVVDVARIMIGLMESNISGERYIVNAVNIPYKELFKKITAIYGKPAPRIRAGNFLREVAWRGEALKAIITGRKPLITKETARTAGNLFRYSSQKVIDTLDYEFRDFDDTLTELSEYYKAFFNK
jgi:nucleoside-diphosphate-sugar epimerase